MTSPTTSAKTFPARFTENPMKWEEYLGSFSPPQIRAAILAPIIFTLLGQGVTFLLRGRPSLDGPTGLIIPWALVAAMVAVLLPARRKVLTSTERKIPALLWAYGTIHVIWVATLGWYTAPAFSLVLVLGLCTIAFHDARYLYAARFLHVYYLLVWPAFFLFLLLIDVAGGPGLLARAQREPGYVQAAIPVVLSIMLVLQIVVAVVGRQWYELDAKQWAHNQAQLQLAEMRREREIVVRSCDFLIQGLAAGRFSHDVASPISTVALSGAELDEGLRDLSSRLLRQGDEASLALVEGLRGATARLLRGQARIHEMTTSMARSLRGEDPPTARPVQELMSATREELRSALTRHRLPFLRPHEQLAAATVVVTSDTASALANIMCNGMLQEPRRPLEIAGFPLDDCFYGLAIRDFGVSEARREKALVRIGEALSLADARADETEERPYEGLGLGLRLAKLVLLRNHGWLTVGVPETGPGLTFLAVLARRPAADIPIERNRPELLAEAWSRRRPLPNVRDRDRGSSAGWPAG